MEKLICIHGHFYQPPRENPWLEAIELQDSANPYHDWNERVTAECYAPNAYARFLDGAGRIERIVSNYSKISFNFGPTLLAWMKEKAADIYQAILDADKESQRSFGGHGAALAQAYNHIILPLANARDKYTQVWWGIRDFESRFGRKPEGMWLPETAADNESLDVLARLGLRFTILSPNQASRVRRLGGGKWRDVNGAHIDPSMAYQVSLPSRRKMAVFFYDAATSQAVAFEGLLNDGQRFAHRLMAAFDDNRSHAQLVHIATDGESYGHHHRYGEMALAYALHHLQSNQLARLTNYGQYLESHPPTHEAEIHQASAWSCSHGVERWRSHCGCNSGGRAGWTQQWRQPLRRALDWLRDQLAPRYEGAAKEYLKDPWTARNEYISVILNRSEENMARFFAHHAARPLTDAEQITALRLLELQRHAMLMFTSCGWFFDDLSGIETVQVIQYAGRALQLARDVLKADCEEGFLDILSEAKSNLPEHGDGRAVYNKFVKPAIVDREKVGAHFAVSSLFESYPKQARIYSFLFEQEDRQEFSAGKAKLVLGRVNVIFEITRASDRLSYGVLHLGDHNLNCGVRSYRGPEAYNAMVQEVSEVFSRADFPQVIRLMDRDFGESNYSLKSLFRDEQRKILALILGSTKEDVESRYRQISDQYGPLMRFLGDLGAPLPSGLQVAEDFVLNAELRKQLESDTPEASRIHALLAEARTRNVALDAEVLAYTIQAQFDRMMVRLAQTPDDHVLLPRQAELAEILPLLPFEANLWKTQNLYYQLLQSVYPAFRLRADKGDEAARMWLHYFLALGVELGFGVEGR